jgi:hypothetical protein
MRWWGKPRLPLAFDEYACWTSLSGVPYQQTTPQPLVAVTPPLKCSNAASPPASRGRLPPWPLDGPVPLQPRDS